MLDLKSDLPEIKILSEGINPASFKVIGSYLYRDDYRDIDIVTANIETGWKLKENAKRNNIKVQIVFLSKDEFLDIEDLLTFRNTAFSYWNGNYKFGDCYIESDKLEFNNNSLKKFKNSKIIFTEIEKMLKRGFKL